jgi:chromosome segregation ATPase
VILSLLDPRVWLFVAAVGAAGYLKGCHDGKGLEKNAHAADQADANREALRLERARQSRVDESVRLAGAREARLRTDIAGAARELDGLRGDLDAIQRASAESLAAANNAVRALGDVFEQCSREYQAVAAEADRAASEVKTLRDAWPTDPPP